MPTNRWLEVQIDLGDAPPAPAEAALLELGAISIEYRDAGDEPILEPAPGTTPLWSTLTLIALFEAGITAEQISQTLDQLPEYEKTPSMRFAVLKDRDWVRVWQQDARPICFADRLWVYPSTCNPEAGQKAIIMDPGLAFGTGTHATTALCLDWIARSDPEGCSILDYGCGSGILAVAGLTLNAASACAVDIDPQALTASQDNAERNHCAGKIEVMLPGDLNTAQHFDMIVANILSRSLIELAPALRQHALPGTRIALSGILTEQADAVRQAYAQWLDLQACEKDGWVLLAGIARTNV
jgi:ribosomal protein L11 methyltransferase